MNACLNLDGAGFAAIELEGRKEAYVFDRFNMPSGKQTQSCFRKGFDAHYTGEHWSTVDLMVMKEWLIVRIQSCLDGIATCSPGHVLPS